MYVQDLLWHHQYDDALEYSKNIMDECVDCEGVFLHLSNIFVRLQQYDHAFEMYSCMLKHYPQNANIYINLGSMQIMYGNNLSALKYYEKSLELNPDLGEVYNGIAMIYLAEKRLDEAMLYFMKAIEKDFDLGIAHYYLGILLDSQKQYAEAVMHFEEAIEKKKGLEKDLYAVAHRDLGVVLSVLQRYEEALDYCQRAIQIDHDEDHFSGMIFILVKKGNHNEALELCHHAIEVWPERKAEILIKMSAILIAQGMYETSIEYYKYAKEYMKDLKYSSICEMSMSWGMYENTVWACKNWQDSDEKFDAKIEMISYEAGNEFIKQEMRR